MGLAFLTACSRETADTLGSVSGVSSEYSESIVSSAVSSTVSTSSSSGTSSSAVTEQATGCKSCALYCVEDSTLLYAENADAKIAPASLTKIITASVALRYVDPEEIVTVGSELKFVQPDSSLAFIGEGERLKMYDLLTGLLLPSGNDAAYTIAVYTARKASGSANMSDKHAVSVFCDMMNDFALELGMENTHFSDPDGWDDNAHYTTANDLIKAAKYALTVPEIREIAMITETAVTFETGETAYWENGNMLIHPDSDYYVEDAIGLKIGATDNAGYCIVAAFAKNGKTYIAVVAGCDDFEERYEKTLDLYEMI